MITAGYSLFVTSLKFDFLKVIIDYEHYVPLNVPHDIGISSLEKLQKAFKKKHYLSGLLLKDVSEFIASEDSLARQQILGILRNVLWKHEFDKRYKAKELISAMYFPYVLNIVHSTEHLERLPQAELREWLICFLYILKNCSRQLVRDWLTKETSDHRIALLAVFRQCLEAFEVSLGPLNSREAATNLVFSTPVAWPSNRRVSRATNPRPSRSQTARKTPPSTP